ncbi:hypothetical protein B0T24DRAFT_105480 [Lasiosphaeria ovina]|uniref:Transmembrane protein n=1 Tax=Lasiosphaeria ovina TaxID=92902 RepID=A0AAE0JVB3_9PEZI|nr:hypothetical protein B0T24DRAFT_105480 [Lasiosphaeria ovina]
MSTCDAADSTMYSILRHPDGFRALPFQFLSPPFPVTMRRGIGLGLVLTSRPEERRDVQREAGPHCWQGAKFSKPRSDVTVHHSLAGPILHILRKSFLMGAVRILVLWVSNLRDLTQRLVQLEVVAKQKAARKPQNRAGRTELNTPAYYGMLVSGGASPRAEPRPAIVDLFCPRRQGIGCLRPSGSLPGSPAICFRFQCAHRFVHVFCAQLFVFFLALFISLSLSPSLSLSLFSHSLAHHCTSVLVTLAADGTQCYSFCVVPQWKAVHQELDPTCCAIGIQ